MSFTLTTAQIIARTKTVTRRKGWLHLKAGEHLLAIEKGMGLKAGEKQVVLDEIATVNVRREPLWHIEREGSRIYDGLVPTLTWIGCEREGFPDLTPEEFIALYCRANGGDRDQLCTRIAFGYADRDPLFAAVVGDEAHVGNRAVVGDGAAVKRTSASACGRAGDEPNADKQRTDGGRVDTPRPLGHDHPMRDLLLLGLVAALTACGDTVIIEAGAASDGGSGPGATAGDGDGDSMPTGGDGDCDGDCAPGDGDGDAPAGDGDGLPLGDGDGDASAGDGDGDLCSDADGDGVCDTIDPCPLDAEKTYPGACGCGVPDDDSDGDGTADCNDGCAADANKTSAGICGCDVSDVDSDGDGVPDCVDECPSDVGDDSDGDGACDSADPCPNDAADDSDGDGLCDGVDVCPLDNPNDSDADGSCDSADICAGFDDSLDGDGDGTPDGCDRCVYSDADADGNGYPDACDVVLWETTVPDRLVDWAVGAAAPPYIAGLVIDRSFTNSPYRKELDVVLGTSLTTTSITDAAQLADFSIALHDPMASYAKPNIRNAANWDYYPENFTRWPASWQLARFVCAGYAKSGGHVYMHWELRGYIQQ